MGLYELEPLALGGSADDGHNSLSLHVLDPLHVLEEMPAIGAPPAAAVRTDYIEAAELPQIAGEHFVELEQDKEPAAVAQVFRALDGVDSPGDLSRMDMAAGPRRGSLLVVGPRRSR